MSNTAKHLHEPEVTRKSSSAMDVLAEMIYTARKGLAHYLDPDRPKDVAPVSMREHKALFDTHSMSIGKYMPYMSYIKERGIFEFDDGVNCAMVFDVKPIATEGRSKEYLRTIAGQVIRCFSSSFREFDESEGEWILQQYRWKDSDLESMADEAYEYADAFAKESPLAEAVLKGMVKKHYNACAKENGLFVDDIVTKQPFIGGIERTKIVIYRKLGPAALKRKRRTDTAAEIERVAKSVRQSLNSIGVELVQNTDFDFFYWLIKFFNEKPNNVSTKEYFGKIVPTADSAGMLPENSPAHIFLSPPRYESEENIYSIGDTHHKFVRVNGLNGMSNIGHLTGEQTSAQSASCLTDQMPAGTMACMTTVFTSRDAMQGIMNRQGALSKSNLNPENKKMRENLAYHEEFLGDKDIRPTMTSLGFYVRGKTRDELDDRVGQVTTCLVNERLVPIQEKSYIDPLAANAFIYNLPMCFDATIPNAKKCLFPLYLHDVANFSFIYGREVGSGNPLLLMFNRSGSVLTKDILSSKDRQANAHMLITGSTGAGKSATLVYLTLLMVAIKRPRLYIIEAGGSFRHVVEFFKEYGLTVNSKTIMPSDASIGYQCPNLSPFADLTLLVSDGVVELTDHEKQLANYNKNASEDRKQKYLLGEKELEATDIPQENGIRALADITAKIDDEIAAHKAAVAAEQKRLTAEQGGTITREDRQAIDEALESEQKDRLGELELIAFSMITGGEQKEMDRYFQSDKWYLRLALQNVGKAAYINDCTSDVAQVAEELYRLAADRSNVRLLEAQRERLMEMAAALGNYTSGFAGDLLNKAPANEEEIFPDVDVTVIDLGTLAKPGQEVLLGIVYVSLLQRLNGLAERYQMTGRLMIKITDECHLVTKNVLTALYIVKVIKLWRKLNGFAWMATQNLNDFPGEAEKMLSMMEWIMMLLPNQKELTLLEALKPLSDEQKEMALSAKRQPKAYTEGCLFGANFDALFRVVQPSESLAMAGTDGEEKHEIELLSKQYNCSHFHAAMIKAAKLDVARGIKPIRYPFVEYTGVYDEFDEQVA